MHWLSRTMRCHDNNHDLRILAYIACCGTIPVSPGRLALSVTIRTSDVENVKSQTKQCHSSRRTATTFALYTGNKVEGQIYIPVVNWLLGILTLACLLFLRSYTAISKLSMCTISSPCNKLCSLYRSQGGRADLHSSGELAAGHFDPGLACYLPQQYSHWQRLW